MLVLLISSSVFVACQDELDRLEPFVNGNPQTFFNNVATFQNGVDGAYSQLWNYYSAPGSGMQGIPDILSDNVVLVTTGRRSNELFYDYRYQANNGGAITLWFSECYEAINAANLVIGQIDNLQDGPDKDNILGQALAVRAWAHFDLVRTYGLIPTQDPNANASLGVTYIKVEDGDTVDPFAQPARETVASNYTEILGDMERASQLIATSNLEGRLDRNGVFGLLSRIYLYNGQYQQAIDAADEVTTSLASPADLPGVYTDSNNAGIVVELSVNTASEANFNNVGVLYSQSNASSTISEYAVEFDFFNSIDPNDLRRNVIQFVGTNQGNDYNAIRKFLGETGQVNGRVDIKVMRAAEVLLNRAEAEFELGDEAAALASLNTLRAQRFAPFVAGTETGAALEAAIQFERRVELSFEGHRWFDLKRRGEPVMRGTNGDIIDGSGTPAEILMLPAGDTRFQLPIPIAEINANPNFMQNPGY
ncbi:RagB/SusD family nutrient uptake outer membrane protein [Spongiimicrobium salis]|uniref:RagB/SusD family nutrient uptake outer membrane protein n=1 Tax=Spongiimicrobium salis TaxID=1667022 RepID=UPI00374D87E1